MLIIILFSALLLVCIICALSIGRYKLISPFYVVKILIARIFGTDWGIPEVMSNVVVSMRLPRIIAAVLIGMGLALSGATYQSIFKNPLVSPDILGVSGGACVGASIAILSHLNNAGVQICAFAGGLAAVILTVSIPKIIRKNSTLMLVLAGIIVGGLTSSIIGITKYVADVETELPELVFWQMGSLSKLKTDNLLAVGPVILVAAIILICMRWRLNVLSLEDRDSKTLGVNIKLERGICIGLATLMTASSVCLAGTIGWVGLVMPHLARLIVGSNNSRAIPVTALLSGSFMLIVDTLARSIADLEIPLGIITGLVGTPFFVFALLRERSVD